MAAVPEQELPQVAPMPSNLRQKIAEKLAQTKLEIAQKIVEQIGQPPDTYEAPDEELLKWWRMRETKATPEVLMSLGVDPALAQGMTTINEHDLRDAGVSEPAIVDLVFPYRRFIVNYGNFSWDDKVKMAIKMRTLDMNQRAEELENG